MESKEIQTWLDSKGSYAAGVELYASLPKPNPTLLLNFRKRESAALRLKLEGELKKAIQDSRMQQKSEIIEKMLHPNFAEKHLAYPYPFDGAQWGTWPKAVDDIPVVNIPKPTPEPEPKTTLLFHQLPPELRPVLLQAHELFKKNCLLKVELNELPAEAEDKALELQLKIYSNQQKNMLCYQKIDHWFEHRSVPAEPADKFDALTPEQRNKRQAYLQASISKLEKRLQGSKDLLSVTLLLQKRTKLQIKITKQSANLLKQKESLHRLTQIIDGRHD